MDVGRSRDGHDVALWDCLFRDWLLPLDPDELLIDRRRQLFLAPL
jgi:hypothetical protein